MVVVISQEQVRQGQQQPDYDADQHVQPDDRPDRFARLDRRVTVRAVRRDGDRLGPGDTVVEIEGPTRPVLGGERVALNFIQRLSGVATLTRRFVEAVAGTRARILDG